ncbi:hypothetical protein M9Y10_003085 [Tritrichomonas musculus]|uniref:Uncharacterized protein n=1 Tax=Tritrichomonas musculus TaxID=1915356 RepID=A0ABR2JPQ2_9EUKA
MSKSNYPHFEQDSFLKKDENSTTTVIVDENPPQKANSRNPINPTINISQKEMKEYIEENKELYGSLIQFLNNLDNNENYFQDLINIICQQKGEENYHKFEEFLQLITAISNNYHREKSFFEKIYQILEHYEVQIKQTFSNKELFDIFQSNKKILLFLFQKEIITIDDYIYNELQYKIERNGNRYYHFFYPEIKKFIGEEKTNDIEKELVSINSDIFDRFEEKRQEGENDSFICSLIREDSVEKFVEYVIRANIPLKSDVIPSLFETNSFLIENKSTTLIEYSAFFGAIQIFQYLRLNEVELKPSLI